MDVSVGGAVVTVKVAEPVMLPDTAEIVVVPVAIAVANPVEPTVATAGIEEAQAPVGVRFWMLPSL